MPAFRVTLYRKKLRVLGRGNITNQLISSKRNEELKDLKMSFHIAQSITGNKGINNSNWRVKSLSSLIKLTSNGAEDKGACA